MKTKYGYRDRVRINLVGELISVDFINNEAEVQIGGEDIVTIPLGYITIEQNEINV